MVASESVSTNQRTCPQEVSEIAHRCSATGCIVCVCVPKIQGLERAPNSQVLAEPRKSKVMLKEAPKGIKAPFSVSR